MSSLSISSITLFPNAQETTSPTMAWPAIWTASRARGTGEILDVTPTSVVLAGAEGLERGDRVNVQIRCAGVAFNVTGKVANWTQVQGGFRVELDRPNSRLFSVLWGGIA
jgi:hypothetical protein